MLATSPILTSAQDDYQAPAWELTGLSEPAFDLMTPTSGAFFAQTANGLQRSDDAGATWHLIGLPFSVDKQTDLQVAVTPTDHTILFVAGPAGVYRTRDDAQTWSLVYPTPNNRVLKLAVSPADSNVVYVALTGLVEYSMWKFIRSRDGGTTFETMDEAHPGPCTQTVSLLVPDPVDSSTLYEAGPCISGRTTSAPLVVSHDQGHTFTAIFNAQFEYPRKLVGGNGANPRRFYLVTTRDTHSPGSTLFRSDDGAQSWASVLESRPGDENPSIVDVAYDPAAPDHVWVANGVAGVRVSTDGGDTWQDDGGQGIFSGRLVLGTDARNLYLATDQGVWRQGQDNPDT